MALSKKRGIIAASITALALVATTALAGCATSNDSADSGSSDAKHVKIGVVGASDPYWKTFVDAAKKEGIEVELKDFTDYNQPNPALSAGELDLNQFQHIVYLADYNVQNNDDLVPVGSTAIYP
ncbi:methionine ABC transporter substrate-binding protein, partial [Leucobacter sp. OLES1]